MITRIEPTNHKRPQAPTEHDELCFRAATNMPETLAAWRLVYNVYRSNGLIVPNPFRLHTATEAVGTNTAVFHGKNGPWIESTLTAIEDSPEGLPLDLVYKAELDQLRAQGRHLVECGLFAHHTQITNSEETTRHDTTPPTSRSSTTRVKESLYQLMRLALYYGLNRCSTDWVIGVHPRHVRFYARAFGFIPIGSEKQYPSVNHKPVVLLHGDLDCSLRMPKTPHVLRYCWDNPVPPTVIEARYDFNHDGFAGSANPLHAYLQYKQAAWSPKLTQYKQHRKVC